MKKKLKLKKSAKKSLFMIIILIILSVFSVKLYRNMQYKKTYEYKLLEINYTLEETKILIKYLKDKELDNVLTLKQNNNIVKLVKEKYFIYNNLNRYLKYLDENTSSDYKNIISLVNVNRDRAFYENTAKTKTEDGKLMLVNKYYNLDKDYEPDNIINVSSSFAYSGNNIMQEVFDAFKELSAEAKNNNHTILINSSYRTYESQESLWERRKSLYGTRKADEYAARAGHSEHQTGYAIDVADFYDVNDKFGETESFTWLKENCYKFGFILRYPEDKENITGYSYEPWHYRYVGKDVALKIKAENITFDEYHAFYLENK